MSKRYRIQQVKLGINESKDELPKKILKKLGRRDYIISDYEIVRESIDARDKNDIKFVYTVDFELMSAQNHKQQVTLPVNGKSGISPAPEMVYLDVPSGAQPLKYRPVIVGFGPCGMFAGLILARRGYRPVILERGNKVEQRVEDVQRFWNEGILDTESNVQFGEGGAGTFSDGKLTTGIKDPRIRKVLSELVKAGADPDIMYKQKPHIGTDVLVTVVRNIRKEIIACGGEVKFGARFEELILKDGAVAGVRYSQAAGSQRIMHEMEADSVIMAMGHSARDTFRALNGQGVGMKQKPFSIGVRIEHPQEMIDRAQYGNVRGLPPADYKLSYHCENGRGVYTFCMCPGGEVVIASSQEGMVVTNGMSNRARNSGTANSALLVDVRCEDFGSDSPLAGVDFQEKYERLAFENGGGNYRAPKCTWGEFRKLDSETGTEMSQNDAAEEAAKASSQAARSVAASLPDFAVESIKEAMPHMGRRIRGFDSDEAVMTATETRSSSPVRFDREMETMEGSFAGLYPAGEGAGYAGGIMSAACDGIKAAEKIIARFYV
ncbi:MAG: NAD(P)/FAD-dependent oxidoreductase [Emergencia sp.]